MPFGASWGCAICGEPIRASDKRQYLVCPVCWARHCGGLKYRSWPAWVKYLVCQERKHRMRCVRQTRQYAEEAFADWLGDYDVDDKVEVLATLTDRWDLVAEMRIDAVQVLRKLTVEERQIVLMSLVGLSYPEIGEVLDITDNAAWSRWVKAKKRLREALTPGA